jgi:hypothetical protein
VAVVGLDVTFRPLEDDEEPSLAFDGLKEMSVQTNTSSHIHCWCDGVEMDILLSQLVAFRYKALLGSCVKSALTIAVRPPQYGNNHCEVFFTATPKPETLQSHGVDGCRQILGCRSS